MKRSYEEEANNLAKVIDIAIEAIQKHTPKGFNPEHINHFVKTYLEAKEKALNPEPQFKTLQSLKYITQDVFTFFQESTGEAVNYFWGEIKKTNLDYNRENKLLKILNKNKIKNQIEYDYVTDMITVAQQEGMLNNEQVIQLNQLISLYESKKR